MVPNALHDRQHHELTSTLTLYDDAIFLENDRSPGKALRYVDIPR